MDTVTKRDWDVINNVDFFLETLSHKRLQHTSIRTREVNEHFYLGHSAFLDFFGGRDAPSL